MQWDKIKSFSLALMTLVTTPLFAADFEITRFGAKEGGVVLGGQNMALQDKFGR